MRKGFWNTIGKVKFGEEEEISMGFKDKQKALDTLKILASYNINYQYQVITGFVSRTKKTLLKTRNEEKLANLQDALDIFENWLMNYKNNCIKENLLYLPIETIKMFRCLAEKYNVWDNKFFKAYNKKNGDWKGLRTIKVPGKNVRWDIERNRRLKEIIGRIKREHIPWYVTDWNDFRGLPTKEHMQCIVLAYSPDPVKLRKLAGQVRDMFSDNDDDDGRYIIRKIILEEKLRGIKRTRDSSSSDSDSEPENEENRKKAKSDALSFKDKDRALQSINSLKGKDMTYQFHVISNLMNRAERMILRTKDEQKIKNIWKAVEVFENWITDYNMNDRSKENFNYLTLDLVRAFKSLADRYGIEDNGFLKVYEEVDGDYKKLRSIRVPGSDVTWDVKRNVQLRELVNRMTDKHIPWFDTNAQFQGLPTAEHTQCIMWGFSHDVTKLTWIEEAPREA